MAAPPSFDAPGRLLSPGRRLGRYTVLGHVGHGGMGELYVARDDEHPETPPLALKVLLPHMASDPELVRMFLNEARYAALLQHPHIAQVYDVGHVSAEHFIAMELVQGPDLRVLLKRVASRGGLPLDVALSILVPITRALHYAHDRCDPQGRPLGLVHRDISPSNVVIGKDGRAKLVDFGLVKALQQTVVTRSGVLKGKLGYMAPEQLTSDQAVDRRTDVFGMGVLLFECTTSRRLFVGDNEFAVMNKVARGELIRPTALMPEYPPALEAIVLRALSRDPDHRYPSADVLGRELVGFADAAKLTLDSGRVAALLHELDLVGPRASLEAVTIPRRGGTMPALGAPASPGRSSRRARLIGLGAAVALGAGLAIGINQFRPNDSIELDAANESATSIESGAPSGSGPGSTARPEPQDEPTGHAGDDPHAEPPPDASPLPPVVELGASPQPRAAPTRRSSRKKGRRRPRATHKDTKPGSSDPLESLLPAGGKK